MFSWIMSFFREKKHHFALVVDPDERLHQVCEPVTVFDKKLERFVAEMGRFMFRGIPWGRPLGLAAPQIGKNIRLFITNEGSKEKSGDIRVFINPILIWATKAPMQVWNEGCFSLEREKYDYSVRRYPSIAIRFQHTDGKWYEERFNGIKAQVIQHEMDHLDGVLINSK